MAILTSSKFMVVELESAPGVPADLSTVSSNIRTRDVESNIDTEKDDEASKYNTGDYGSGIDESIIGMKKGSVTTSIKISSGEYTPDGGGGAEHKLNYGLLLQGCGLEYQGVNTTSADDLAGKHIFYPQSSKSEQTLSIGVRVRDAQANGGTEDITQLTPVYGCMGNMSIETSPGKPLLASFDFGGRVDSVDDYPTSALPEFDSAGVMRTTADVFLNSTVKVTNLETLEEHLFCVASLNFDTANENDVLPCQETNSGIENSFVGAIAPTLTIKPRLTTKVDFNWWKAISENSDYFMVEIDTEDFHLVVPRGQMMGADETDEGGVLYNDISVKILSNIDEYVPADIVGTPPATIAGAVYYITVDEELADY